VHVVWGLQKSGGRGFYSMGFALETKTQFFIPESLYLEGVFLFLFSIWARGGFPSFLLFLLYFIVSYVARVLLEGSSSSFLSVY